MADGFEISVPITIKGGNEGDKVGRQIGEKIASQLNKSFKLAGISGKPSGAGQVAGMTGVSKGLKGISTKLGIVGAAIAATVGLLSKASPYLKGILSMFGRAFMIFFRPFGDFLATLLRPLAILMMKMAVAFIKWTRPIVGAAKEGMEKAPQIPLTESQALNVPIQIANWVLQVGGAIGQVAYEIGKGAFELGGKIGQWLYDEVIKPAGDWIYGKLVGLWNWVKDFPGWLWEKITSIWIWTNNLGVWLWEKIKGIWAWTFDFGLWLWEKITSIWKWEKNFGSWLWEKITSIVGNIFKGPIGKVLGYQTGTPYVPSDGLYQLHKGEEVVPRTRAGNNKSVIFKPTFQINGNITQDIDMDSIVRRAGRMTEMELKQRGII